MLSVIALILAGLLLVLGIVIEIHLVFWTRNEVPFVLAPTKTIEQIICALNLNPDATLVDLGCGDGRVLHAAKKKSIKIVLIGIENNPVAVVLARLKLGRSAIIKYEDVLSYDLRTVTRVFCYLGDGVMAKLEPRFEQQLKPGSRLVSMQFKLPNRKPVEIINLTGGRSHANRLYVYDF